MRSVDRTDASARASAADEIETRSFDADDIRPAWPSRRCTISAMLAWKDMLSCRKLSCRESRSDRPACSRLATSRWHSTSWKWVMSACAKTPISSRRIGGQLAPGKLTGGLTSGLTGLQHGGDPHDRSDQPPILEQQNLDGDEQCEQTDQQLVLPMAVAQCRLALVDRLDSF